MRQAAQHAVRVPRGARRLLAATFALCAASALPAVAAAQDGPAAQTPYDERSPSGVRVALRSGVAVPLGEAFVTSGKLSSTITGYVPLRLDLGYRFARHFYVGVAAQLAVIVPNGCPEDSRCSGTSSRFGAMVAYHLLPDRPFDPWLGAGMGFETLKVSRAVNGTGVDVSARGLELLDVELGADVRATRALRLGPVLSTSIGRYTTVSVNGTPTRDFDTALHAWVMFGFRGAFDL